MLITSKQKPVGIMAIVAAFLVFGGYFWFLLEPMQTQLINQGKAPTFGGTLLGSAAAGSAVAFLAEMGLILIGASRKCLDFTFGKLFKSKEFWKWMVWVNAVVLFFSLMWKYGNF